MTLDKNSTQAHEAAIETGGMSLAGVKTPGPLQKEALKKETHSPPYRGILV